MKFKPILGSDLSGHIGGVVASHNTYGPYFRQRVRPVNKKTPAQQAQRGAVAGVAQSWRALTPGLQAAWQAANIVKISKKGDRVTLTGNAAFQYVNTIRYRAGLTIIETPPASSAVPALTTPSMTFTASSTINLGVNVADEWNASGGWLIASAKLLLSAGQTYGSPNLATTIEVGPIGSSPLPITLPFDVPIGGRARLELHAGSPDGRLSQYVTVEATNPSFAPAPGAPANVLEVVVTSATRAVWVFDRPLVQTSGAGTGLQINGVDAETTVPAGPTAVETTYASIGVGQAYGITAQPGGISTPLVIGQTGTTMG